MLKVFDKQHEVIGSISKYKDLKIVSELSTADKMLTFTLLEKNELQPEFYVQTGKDEYVVKELSAAKNVFTSVTCALNLEELEAKPWATFSVADTTIDAAARLALADTGWTVGSCDVTKKRNAGMMDCSSLEVLQNLAAAFMCELSFDTIQKTVSFWKKRGDDKGAYFIEGLNLKKLIKKESSYDYYTQMIPVGANDLQITEVNDGKNYIENFQYSRKKRCYIWKDDSYTDAQALKEDAELKLQDMSKPEVSYSADIIDLASQKSGYDILGYSLGDTVVLIDKATGTREKQRIIKITEYPENPQKNTCELSNAFLTFTEMSEKYKKASDIINFTISGTGQYTGKINVSDILHFETGLAGSETIGNLRNAVNTNAQNIFALSGEFGKLSANILTAEKADIQYARIDKANIENGWITTAMIDREAVGTAQIADGSITDAKVVELTANKITAGTLSVERLEIRGNENSLVYALNNIDGALQAKSVDTLNGEILTKRSITADKIVAKAITANEIASETITANEILAGAITAAKIASAAITTDKLAANAVTAAKIDVDDLFAQDITATGTIRGTHLIGATGNFSGDLYSAYGMIGGWNIGKKCLYVQNIPDLYDTGLLTIVLQNLEMRIIRSVSYSGSDCNIEAKDKKITVTPISSGKITLNIIIPITRKGSYKIGIDDGYVKTGKNDRKIEANYTYTSASGVISGEWFELTEMTGIPQQTYSYFEFEIPEDEITEFKIIYVMPSAVAGEDYEFEIFAYINGDTYQPSDTVLEKIPENALLAVKKELEDDTTLPMYFLTDGTIYTTGNIYEGGVSLTSKYAKLSHTHPYIPLSGASSITGDLIFANSGTAFRGIRGTVGDNDFWRVMGGASASDAGYLEIATADGGNEPIYIRQYTGVFSTIKRTVTLLNGNGNTSFPGTVSAAAFSGKLNGNASTATQVYGTLGNPTSGAWYAIPFHANVSSENKTLLNNDGITYYSLQGTVSALGHAYLRLGNAKASGTAGNKQGHIRIYGTSSGYTDIVNAASTSNFTITLPAASGTVSLTSHSHSWASITGKPESFNPSLHEHSYAGSLSAGGEANSAVKAGYIYDDNKNRAASVMGTVFRIATTDGLKTADFSLGASGATHRWKQVYATATTISTSDRSQKHDIHELSEKYEQLFLRLIPVSFLYNSGESGRTHIGFISQDVEEAMEELGMTSLDFAGFCKDQETVPAPTEDDPDHEEPAFDEEGNPVYIYSLRYEEFIALNTHMVQRLYAKINKFEAKITELEKGI